MNKILLVTVVALAGCAAVPKQSNEKPLNCVEKSPPPAVCESADDAAQRYQQELMDLYKALDDCPAGRN